MNTKHAVFRLCWYMRTVSGRIKKLLSMTVCKKESWVTKIDQAEESLALFTYLLI